MQTVDSAVGKDGELTLNDRVRSGASSDDECLSAAFPKRPRHPPEFGATKSGKHSAAAERNDLDPMVPRVISSRIRDPS